MRIRLLVILPVLAAALAMGRPSSAQAPTAPAAAAPLQTQDTNVSGVVAELTECKRKEGVLTVKIRFRNTSGAEARVDLISGRNYDQYYVTAQSKKYFILRDSEQTPLAPATDGFGGLGVKLPANGTWTWWAKYPAPPPEVKSVSYFTPLGAPFEDVPVTDM
jgi:hypothetical protein